MLKGRSRFFAYATHVVLASPKDGATGSRCTRAPCGSVGDVRGRWFGRPESTTMVNATQNTLESARGTAHLATTAST